MLGFGSVVAATAHPVPASKTRVAINFFMVQLPSGSARAANTWFRENEMPQARLSISSWMSQAISIVATGSEYRETEGGCKKKREKVAPIPAMELARPDESAAGELFFRRGDNT